MVQIMYIDKLPSKGCRHLLCISWSSNVGKVDRTSAPRKLWALAVRSCVCVYSEVCLTNLLVNVHSVAILMFKWSCLVSTEVIFTFTLPCLSMYKFGFTEVCGLQSQRFWIMFLSSIQVLLNCKQKYFVCYSSKLLGMLIQEMHGLGNLI